MTKQIIKDTVGNKIIFDTYDDLLHISVYNNKGLVKTSTLVKYNRSFLQSKILEEFIEANDKFLKGAIRSLGRYILFQDGTEVIIQLNGNVNDIYIEKYGNPMDIPILLKHTLDIINKDKDCKVEYL